MSERVHVSGSAVAEALSGLSRYERQAEELQAQLISVMAVAERACSDDVRSCERALDQAKAIESRLRDGRGDTSARRAVEAATDNLRRSRVRRETVLRANQKAKSALAQHRSGRQQAIDRGRSAAGRSAEQIGEYLNVPGALGRLAVGGTAGGGASPATIAGLGRAAVSGSDDAAGGAGP